jgi:DNA-binding NarL/FixJ family response regulator
MQSLSQNLWVLLMEHQITILHKAQAVGETIAGSLGFDSPYQASYMNFGSECKAIPPGTSLLLTDAINFVLLSKSGRFIKCPVVLLIDDFEDPLVLEALNLGVAWIIDLSRGPEKLIGRVRQFLEHKSDDHDVLIRQLIDHYVDKTKNGENDCHLTLTEKHILKQLRAGVHLKMIAHNTGTSYETVRTHVKHIYRKIGVMSAPEAVIKAMKMDLE